MFPHWTEKEKYDSSCQEEKQDPERVKTLFSELELDVGIPVKDQDIEKEKEKDVIVIQTKKPTSRIKNIEVLLVE